MTTTTQVRIAYADGRIEERSLTLGKHRIGRDAGEIVLGDPNISALHAELDVQPGRVVVQDLGSSNGTFDVSGIRLSAPTLLLPNQSIRLGSSAITLLPAQPERGGTHLMPQFTATPVPTSVSLPGSAPPPAAASQVARGTIIKVPDQTPGLLVVNGAQLPFGLEGVWRSPIAPQVNLVVQVELSPAGGVASLTAVDSQQLAKERLNQLGDAAQAQAKQAAQLAKQSLSALLGGRGLFAAGGALVLLLVVGGAYALGFGSELSKRSLANKINAKLQGLEKKDHCWKLQNMNVSFPLTVAPSAVEGPIIAGLEKGGYIAIQRQGSSQPGGLITLREKYAPVVISLTDKGRDAKVWDAKDGFCPGQPEVGEVLRWTEPAPSGAGLAIRIDYTWKLADRPSWASEELFPTLEGLAKPEEGLAIAQKTSEGWEVVIP